MSFFPLILFIFFLSGMTGLIYEVVWAKFLVLFIGNTTYAHTIVIAVFMGGLALGNYLFGRVVDRIPRYALLLYGLLELGIGIYALTYPAFFNGVKTYLFIPLASGHLGSPWVVVWKFALSFLTMILPTVLMGGTLPVLSRFFVRNLSQTKREVARLYFLNSLGGAMGCLLAGFLLIPTLGLSRPVLFTGGWNILLGLIVLVLYWRLPQGVAESVSPQGKKEASLPEVTPNISWLLMTIALSGAIVMIYEIAWIRLLSLVLGSLTYSFALMLSAFIFGIALGALILERVSPWVRRPLLWFGLLQIGIALSVAGTLPLYERLPYFFLQIRSLMDPTHPNLFVFQLSQFGLCFFLMMLPTTLSGMTLPLVSHLASRRLKILGRSVGMVFSWNTLGTVVGAMVAGLFLLPYLGTQRTLQLGSLLSLVTGAIILILVRSLRVPVKGWLLTGSLGVLLTIFLLVPRWDPLVMHAGVYRGSGTDKVKSFADFKNKLHENRKSIFYEEGMNASVAVEQWSPSGIFSELYLRINGKVDATSSLDQKTQLLLAHLPMIWHPNAKRVLVIGFGSGMSVGAILQYPVERVDVVEIEPKVLKAAVHFSKFNNNALEDPRVHLHQEDARTFLLLNKTNYDVILSEPSNPWIAGIGNLYTREFYQLVEQALEEDGIFSQWFHSDEQTDELIKVIFRTFLDVFPHASLWNAMTIDYILLGTREKLSPDWLRMEEVMAKGKVQKDLMRMGMVDVPALLSVQALSDETVRRAAGEGPRNLDDFPILEYQLPKALYRREKAKILEKLDERRIPPGPDLWLSQFRVEKDLEEGNYRNIYRHHITRSHSVPRLLDWIVVSWMKDFPQDERAKRIAILIWHEKNNPRALGLVEEMLSQRPGDPHLLMWRAFLIYRGEAKKGFHSPPSQKLLAATAAMGGAVAEVPAPQRALYYLYLGKIYESLKNWEQAIQSYQEALRLKQASPAQMPLIRAPQIYRLLALAYARQGNKQQARYYQGLAKGTKAAPLPPLGTAWGKPPTP